MRKKEKDITAREFDVLKLVAKGYSNKEIAEKLYITHHTVKAHLSQVFKKLGVTNRTSAAVLVNETNFIPHQDSKRP